MRRCDREGVEWPPPMYGPPRPGRRCGWCDRADDAVAFGYDHLPPACPDHLTERRQALDAIRALHTDATGQWTKARAPESSVQRVYDAGEAFVRGTGDDGWTLWPQPRARRERVALTDAQQRLHALRSAIATALGEGPEWATAPEVATAWAALATAMDAVGLARPTIGDAR